MNKRLILEILTLVTGTAAIILSGYLENDISKEVLNLCDPENIR